MTPFDAAWTIDGTMDDADDFAVVDLKLNCFIGSSRMCACICIAASRFISKITLSRGGDEANAREIFQTMTAEAEAIVFNEEQLEAMRTDGKPWLYTRVGPRYRTLRIKTEGADAYEAMAAMLRLFPRDGGASRCIVPGCGNPAYLTGPGSDGGFRYRCALYKLRHDWQVFKDGSAARYDAWGPGSQQGVRAG